MRLVYIRVKSPPVMEAAVKSKTSSIRFWGIFLGSAVIAGLATGFVLLKTLKPDAVEYVVDGGEYEMDVKAAMTKYEKVKGKGSYATSLTPEEIIAVGYAKFGEEKQTYSVGVGYTQAAMVRQSITTRTVRMDDRYFEESNSEGMINIHDRMFQEGDSTTKYWGASDDYGSNAPVTVDNETYKKEMGRYVSEALVYTVSPATLIERSPVGDPDNGVFEEGGGYRVEVNLDPITGVTKYQCQMQCISSLKLKPEFEYAHLTVTLDADLNLISMATHEKYFATTNFGVGSNAEGRLVTRYYHEAPSFGFPSPGSTLPAFPASL